MPEVLIERLLIRAVPRMTEWEQGHDWIVDGDQRLEIAWMRDGADWTFWSAAADGDKRAEATEDVILHCPGRGKQLNQSLMDEIGEELRARCSELS